MSKKISLLGSVEGGELSPDTLLLVSTNNNEHETDIKQSLKCTVDDLSKYMLNQLQSESGDGSLLNALILSIVLNSTSIFNNGEYILIPTISSLEIEDGESGTTNQVYNIDKLELVSIEGLVEKIVAAIRNMTNKDTPLLKSEYQDTEWAITNTNSNSTQRYVIPIKHTGN